MRNRTVAVTLVNAVGLWPARTMTRRFAILAAAAALLAGAGQAQAQNYFGPPIPGVSFFGGDRRLSPGGVSPIPRTSVYYPSNYAPGTIVIDPIVHEPTYGRRSLRMGALVNRRNKLTFELLRAEQTRSARRFRVASSRYVQSASIRPIMPQSINCLLPIRSLCCPGAALSIQRACSNLADLKIPALAELSSTTFRATHLSARLSCRFNDLSINLFTSGQPSATVMGRPRSFLD